MKPLTYTIIEYQSFGIDEIFKAWTKQKDKECKEIKERAKKFFVALENFQKSSQNHSKFLKHSSKHKLKAQNYVGIIQTKHGILEILPKCFVGDTLTLQISQTPTNSPKESKKQDKEKLEEFFAFEVFEHQFSENENQESLQSQRDHSPKIKDFTLSSTPKQSTQNFLLFCLKTLKKDLFKSSHLASLSTTYTPLLEIFIQMFCQELLEVCKKGIRHDYVAIEDNRAYLKGKLVFGGQIRHNLIHKERFYTSSDEYITDIAPNRLIKSTLELLSTLSTSHTTHSLINHSLEIFEEIPSSGNIEGDFLSCPNSRHFSHYDKILKWCELFLNNQSFTTYSGESEAYALLFPMEKLFESYVAHMFKHSNPSHTIHTQSSSKYLLHSKDSKLFQLKPDLLLNLENKRRIIADTKWKTLKKTEDKKNGISQADLHQLFAYAHYYKAHEVWLIYPKLYAQDESNQNEKNEILKIIQNLQEWDGHHYQHPCSLENNDHQIRIKILLAPLAFHQK
ncbi:McrC family protein [Helicobacter pametensis]|uniref:McrC family protein n=1 Tax=Helicobacter pametensis TaxID=95149 RepID=UPI000486E179|nr:McrC family protein [Helicobacter pametensis]